MRKLGRVLFESLSVKRDRQGCPLMFRRGLQAVVLRDCVPQVLEMVDSAHNGPDRACLLAQRSYYWEGMKTDIRQRQRRIFGRDIRLTSAGTMGITFISIRGRSGHRARGPGS